MASSKKPAASQQPAATPAPAPTAHPMRRATDAQPDGEGTITAPSAASPFPTAHTPSAAPAPATSGNGAKVPVIAGEIAGTVLTLTFQDGRKLTIDGAKLSDEIRTAAMMHGLKQKTVDAAAIARDQTTGRSATIDDKYDAVKEIVDRLTGENATWNKVREGGGAAPGSNLLVRALMELSGKSRADTVAFLEAKSKEEVAALRRNDKVIPIIARLQAEDAKANKDGAKVDSEALLGDFMGKGE